MCGEPVADEGQCGLTVATMLCYFQIGHVAERAKHFLHTGLGLLYGRNAPIPTFAQLTSYQLCPDNHEHYTHLCTLVLQCEEERE